MRLWIASLLVVAAFARPTFAQSDAQSGAPQDRRLRTVVMGIVPRHGVTDVNLAHALSDVVLGAYAADPQRVVIGPDDIRRVLEWEASRQQAGCNDSACLAEVGAALNANRIVSGTLDALGDGYMLTLAEIDAQSLEPIARAQEEVPKSETELVRATRRLAEQLRARAQLQPSTTAAALFSGSSGSIELNTDPRGALVLVGGQSVGTTPTRIDNVAAGRHRVRITRDDYETIDVDIPVHPGGTTMVTAELRILRAIAEQNLVARQAKWRDTDQMNLIAGWTKVGAGVVVGGAGAALAVGSISSGASPFSGDVLGPVLVVGIGAGLIGWGSIDLLNPPKQPVAEWDLERKVTVTPPKGTGDVEVKRLQEAAAASTVER